MRVFLKIVSCLLVLKKTIHFTEETSFMPKGSYLPKSSILSTHLLFLTQFVLNYYSEAETCVFLEIVCILANHRICIVDRLLTLCLIPVFHTQDNSQIYQGRIRESGKNQGRIREVQHIYKVKLYLN